MANKIVSFLPSDMVQGGLLDDGDVTFTAASFVLFDYQGKNAARTALRVEMTDAEGAIHEQFYSAADPKHFVPSDDGKHIVSTSDKANLNKGTNFDLFLTSLINAGFPEPKLRTPEGIAAIVDTKAHVVRVTTKRTGIIQEDAKGPQTTVTVSKLIALPGATAAGSTGAAAKGSGKGRPNGQAGTATSATSQAQQTQAQAQSAGAGDDETLTDLVLEGLKSVGGTGNVKKAIVPYVFRNAKGDPATKKAITFRVAAAEFLEAGMAEGKWLYDEASGDLTSMD